MNYQPMKYQDSGTDRRLKGGLKPMPDNVPEEKETPLVRMAQGFKRMYREQICKLLGIHGYIIMEFTKDNKMLMKRRMSRKTPPETLQYACDMYESIQRIVKMVNMLSEHGANLNDLLVMPGTEIACATCPGYAELAGKVQPVPIEEPLPPLVMPNEPTTISHLTKGVKF